eukprot:6490704-Alexandrium_andersonii.AAC.1
MRPRSGRVKVREREIIEYEPETHRNDHPNILQYNDVRHCVHESGRSAGPRAEERKCRRKR